MLWITLPNAPGKNLNLRYFQIIYSMAIVCVIPHICAAALLTLALQSLPIVPWD